MVTPHKQIWWNKESLNTTYNSNIYPFKYLYNQFVRQFLYHIGHHLPKCMWTGDGLFTFSLFICIVFVWRIVSYIGCSSNYSQFIRVIQPSIFYSTHPLTQLAPFFKIFVSPPLISIPPPFKVFQTVLHTHSFIGIILGMLDNMIWEKTDKGDLKLAKTI